MTFKRFLYLIGELPRVFRLIRELWRILVESDDQKLKEYLEDISNVSLALKEAKTPEDRMVVATYISSLFKQLRE